jgi:hypothetical protein
VRWLAVLVAARAGVAQQPVANAVDPAAAVLASRLADPNLPYAMRSAALVGLQERAALRPVQVVAVLAGADRELAAAAAALVRHTWLELPAELFAALDAAPLAAQALLAELAVAPRPSAAVWAGRVAADATQDLATRCLALAAAGRAPVRAEAELLLTALLADELLPFVAAAFERLPAEVADGLVGRLHQALAAGSVPVARALPLVERLSPRGLRMLLSSAVALPDEPRDALCLALSDRAVPAYLEQVAAVLDGEGPLEAHWLWGAETLLQHPARQQRLLAVLADARGDADHAAALQERVFATLLRAQWVGPEVLAYARRQADNRSLVLLLERGGERLADDLLLDLLDGPPQVAAAAAQALLRRPALTERLQTALLAVLGNAQVVGGELLPVLALAVLRLGSDEAVTALWPHLRHAHRLTDFVGVLLKARPQLAVKLWQRDLAADPADAWDRLQPRERLELLLGLVALEPQAWRKALVREALAAPEPTFLSRCAVWARELDAVEVASLLDAAAAQTEEQTAAALVAWAAAAAKDATNLARLAQWAFAGAASEVQEAALAGLAAGPGRELCLRRLRQNLAAPSDEAAESLAYAVLAGLPEPLDHAALELCAAVLLRWPVADADGEARRAARWPDGQRGFSLAVAVAERLRGADPDAAAAAFGAVARELAALPAACRAIAPQRLLVFWRALAREPEVQQALGAATAPLFLDLREVPDLGVGVAHWFLAMAMAEVEAEAGGSSRAALLAALRHRQRDRLYEPFGGAREPGSGVDGLARLAALPFRHAAAAARRAGDARGYTAAVAQAREFAGRDAVTLEHLQQLPKTLNSDPPR